MKDNKQANNGIGKIIKSKRTILGQTQILFASRNGLDSQKLSLIETERRRKITKDELEKIAKGLGVTVEALVNEAAIENQGKVIPVTPATINILPLLQSIAKTTCSTITLEDVRFLIDVQKGLGEPAPSALVDALMTSSNKSLETNTEKEVN